MLRTLGFDVQLRKRIVPLRVKTIGESVVESLLAKKHHDLESFEQASHSFGAAFVIVKIQRHQGIVGLPDTSEKRGRLNRNREGQQRNKKKGDTH